MGRMKDHFLRLRRCCAKVKEDPLGSFVSVVSFEVILLTRRMRPNGGDVILARAFLSTLLLYLIAIAIYDLSDTSRSFKFSPTELMHTIHGTLAWFGAIFAAMYAGLYARFASQWAYLANLYNQIKGAEIRLATSLAEKKLTDRSVKAAMQRLAEWKAGYIEDAENLHLATKKSVAPVIRFWLGEKAVRFAYVDATPGGKERCPRLLDAVKKVMDRLDDIKGYQK